MENTSMISGLSSRIKTYFTWNYRARKGQDSSTRQDSAAYARAIRASGVKLRFYATCKSPDGTLIHWRYLCENLNILWLNSIIASSPRIHPLTQTLVDQVAPNVPKNINCRSGPNRALPISQAWTGKSAAAKACTQCPMKGRDGARYRAVDPTCPELGYLCRSCASKRAYQRIKSDPGKMGRARTARRRFYQLDKARRKTDPKRQRKARERSQRDRKRCRGRLKQDSEAKAL